VEKLEFGKTGLWVSRVAMGGIPIMRLRKKEAVDVVKEVLGMGINFIDTATGYGDSEEKIGEALKGKKREDLVIASKAPASDKKTFLEHVDLSLKRMGIDYIDIYHLHGVNSEEKMKQVMGPGGAYEGLQEAIERGEVRHAAFSSHHMPLQRAFEFIEPAVQKARECTECEECIERCPYDLAIPELLKKNTAFWEKCKRKVG